MYSLFDSSDTEYPLPLFLLPKSLFGYPKDAQLQRQDGATSNTLQGDSYIKAGVIKLSGKGNYSTVADRDAAISGLKTNVQNAAYIIIGNTSIALQTGFLMARTNSTSLQVDYEMTLIPTTVNQYNYVASGLFWGNSTVTMGNATYNYGGN